MDLEEGWNLRVTGAWDSASECVEKWNEKVERLESDPDAKLD